MNRIQLERIISKGEIEPFKIAINEYLSANTSIKDYHYLSNKIIKFNNSDENIVKIAILSSFTFDQLKEYIIVENFKYGLFSNIFVSGYNQYNQDILNKKSDLNCFKPDFLILALRLEELFPQFDNLPLFHSRYR